jgi:hypothetical protein
MVLVHSGEEWPHARPPCSKEMTRHLEHNEKIVSWLQPSGGGVEDQVRTASDQAPTASDPLKDEQVPVLRIKGQYFRLSLRMMKSIWRHVRLKKGFVNVERAPYGGMKLKIPTLLLTEKMRTQSRFNVSPIVLPCFA